MSHHPDESGLVPGDSLFTHPYAVPSDGPSGPTAPAWPQSGPAPLSFHGFEPREEATAARDAASAVPRSRRAAGRERDGGRGSRLPAAALTLIALGLAGGLVYLLSGPDEEEPPARAEAPLRLSLPALPARSPDGSPSPEVSVRSVKPSASASAQASASASQGSPKPGPSASASAGQASYGTLRMGDSGSGVRALQERLFGQGFTYVATTGVYDSQTRRGVAQLQRDRDIKGDQPGVYGPATQAAFPIGG
ncbi:peptidoglycan-binding protein [Streptomyces sp. NPDC006463]|uniref:peptidoglycan-binding domain-containing protein n=1 Tax=Streptomyces sp. NPDC006463 TaxID=3364746 RepID=UPI00369B0603